MNLFKDEQSNKRRELFEILCWIDENSADTDAIDRINKATFPHTSAYRKYKEQQSVDEKNFNEFVDGLPVKRRKNEPKDNLLK